MKTKKKNIILWFLLIVLFVFLGFIIYFKGFKGREGNNNDIFDSWTMIHSQLYIDDKLIDENFESTGEYIIINKAEIVFCYSERHCNKFQYKTNDNTIEILNFNEDGYSNVYNYELNKDKLTLTVLNGSMKVINEYNRSQG